MNILCNRQEQEQEQESLFVFRPLASFTKNTNTLHIYAAQYVFEHSSSDNIFTYFKHTTYTYNYVTLLFQINQLSVSFFLP